MRLSFPLTMFFTSLSLAMAIVGPGYSTADEPVSKLEVSLRKPADKATVVQKDARVVISIDSASGIGGAEVKLAAGSWPKTIVLKLRLKDLEGLTVENGSLRLQTSSKHAKPEVSLRAADGKWSAAPAGAAHHVTIKRAAERMEVELPAVLFGERETSVRVQWVDFYR